jgi:hypothetical protein
MALLDWEGFDRETANLNIFSSTGLSISADGAGFQGYGRNANTTSGSALRLSAFAPISDGFFQCHARIDSVATNTGMQFRCYLGATEQCQVRLDLDQKLALYRGSTRIAASSVTYPINAWFFIQIRFHPAVSSGNVEVRVNGATVLSFSGNTANSGSDGWDGWSVGGSTSPSTMYWDNIVVYSASGAVPNTWTPETRIWDTLPTSAGGSTAWTPVGAASNWQCVNEQPSNGDSTYVRADSAGLTDTYSCPAAAETGSIIYGVAVHATLRKDDAGTNEVDGVIRVASTNYLHGTPKAVNSSYSRERWLWTQNPATSAAWTPAEANSAQPGIRRTT